MRFVRNWKISVPVAVVALAGLAWLAFGFFGIHTAFIDEEVSEALPEFDVPTDAAADVVTTAEDGEPPAEEPVAATDEVADGNDVEDRVDGSAPTESVATEPVATEPVATEPGEVAPEVTEPAATESGDPVIVTEAAGAFSGANGYNVSGQALVLGNGTGQRFLRFEDFESSNGPDLNVYLFNPDDSNDFVDLGDLKGNIGEQNYEIAIDVDLDRYSEVSIWCVRFGTGFGSADLTAA